MPGANGKTGRRQSLGVPILTRHRPDGRDSERGLGDLCGDLYGDLCRAGRMVVWPTTIDLR
jgi:hypothetical protein